MKQSLSVQPVHGPQFYKKLPRRYRVNDILPLTIPGSGTDDPLKFTERFCWLFGSRYDEIRRNYFSLLDYGDPISAPESILTRLAQDRGWNLDEELPVDFRRLLVRNIRVLYKYAGTEYGIWYSIYCHTGINVQIRRNLAPQNCKVSKTGYLIQSYSGGLTVKMRLNTAGYTWDDYFRPVENERVHVHWLGTVATGIVDSYNETLFPQILTLKHGLAFTFPPETHVVFRPSFFPFDSSMISVSGRHFMQTGDMVGIKPVGSPLSYNMTREQKQELHTLVIVFPFNPVTELGFEQGTFLLNLCSALIDFMKPFRSYYQFVYNDFIPFEFKVGFSRVGTQDRVL